MQKNNMVLMGIIALILFLPSSSKSETSKTWVDKVSKYELISNEGFVAFECNETEVVNKENVETVIKCECKGTGKITTGDNRVLSCPCKNCTCVKTNKINLTIDDEKENTDTVSEEKDYIQSLEARCVLITNPSFCVPCAQLEKFTLKELKKAGYKIGTEQDTRIHIAVLDETSPVFERYGHKLLPLFLFVKNGKVVKELTGYQTSIVIADEINKILKDE